MQESHNSGEGPTTPYHQRVKTVRKESFSNSTIAISAFLCFGGLILVVATTLFISEISHKPNDANLLVEPTEKKAKTPVVTQFEEGYSMILPSGFAHQTKRMTEDGDIVYGFTSEDGCILTFAIINDDSIERFSSPPKTYSASLVERVPELSEGTEGEVPPERISVGGMPSVLFRFYEKETYRGVIFTYHMVTMDRGTKLVIKTSGKYGSYSDEETNIRMPDHWYDSMLSLQRVHKSR
ncbi:hypothetical protein N9A80_02305 [Rhodopirellula sp.]|nr:hypothetical protein [Rhodopirellula sp.]